MAPKEESLDRRSTAAVFEDHLHLRKERKLEEDIARNYSPEAVMITMLGKYRGHDGVRRSAGDLQRYFPNGNYKYVKKEVEGELAFLAWQGVSNRGEVCDGVDTFIIRDGKILYQTIHYNVDTDESPDGE